eukprot:1150334-Pelagomonas_calceolata.AAC.3
MLSTRAVQRGPRDGGPRLASNTDKTLQQETKEWDPSAAFSQLDLRAHGSHNRPPPLHCMHEGTHQEVRRGVDDSLADIWLWADLLLRGRPEGVLLELRITQGPGYVEAAVDAALVHKACMSKGVHASTEQEQGYNSDMDGTS